MLVLETAHPAAIRRQVSLCEAVYEGETAVEGMRGIRVETLADADAVWAQNAVPVLIDPTGACLLQARPAVLVDAIIAKKNLGTTIDMAPLVIGVGPGFTAGQDVHLVIESMRGHNLARIITDGMAQPNTGVPGNIAGFTSERVIHAPAAGYIHDVRKIGDIVQKGDEIARIYPDKESYDNALSEYVPVNATITGIIRGLIREGYYFRKGVQDSGYRSARE